MPDATAPVIAAIARAQEDLQDALAELDALHVVQADALAVARHSLHNYLALSSMTLDVVVRDRADVAERLRYDEVGLELGDELLVEGVDRLAGAGALAHGGVDLGGREALRQDVARDRQDVGRVLGVVALVRDTDHVVAEPQREQELGSVWDEGDDPHNREGMARPCLH